VAVTVLGIAACEEDDAVYGPLVDTTPPVISITDVSQSGDTLKTSVKAEDFISVSLVVTEIRRTDQLETIITAEGDTITLGRLLTCDTARTAGRVTEFTVNTSWFLGFTQPTQVQVRAIAEDSQGNRSESSAFVIVGGGPGGGLGGPNVSIYSPMPGQTVRDNTLIRVGIIATDPTGLAQLNVLLFNPDVDPPAIPAADTIRFAEFRTSVDTLLDFFIPSGALGELTITAEAINLNSISGFASITVTVAQQVTDDANPPVVSMVVTGGVQRRQDEPLRMEADDSLLVMLVAFDRENAITRVGVTVVVRNERTGGLVTVTVFDDNVFATPISGTVPFDFAFMPADPRFASVFTEDDIPDTLFFELTAWAFDAATPANCGATVDTQGSEASLPCTGSDPRFAQGISGGVEERLIVSGRTVGFPQGALISDAAVDTLRELLLLSDFEFGAVRPFDLRNEVFLRNVPVGSEPWGLGIDLSEDNLLVSNSGGTNISVVSLGPRTPGAANIQGEVDRYQTQDLQVYQVVEDWDAFGVKIYPVRAFDFSDRPQFIAQAANGLILYSTRPALADEQPGTIREYDPSQRELRFFIDYAVRRASSTPQIQIVNADSVFGVDGNRRFKICDHERGNRANADCVFVSDSLGDARVQVDAMNMGSGWDVLILTDLVISSIGLQDTTFVAASGDREFVAFGEGDTPDRPGRIIMYRSATQTITNSLQVTDLTGNAAQRVYGLALNLDGSLGVGRGEVAFFFGPDVPGGPNVLRLLGTNNDVNPEGVGAALHPDHQNALVLGPDEQRLSFLGSGDARVEIVDTYFFDFSRGEMLIRDPIVGPLRITRRLPPDPANVLLKLYGVTENGVVVISVRDTDVEPLP
jgi:hypothetical protein